MFWDNWTKNPVVLSAVYSCVSAAGTTLLGVAPTGSVEAALITFIINMADAHWTYSSKSSTSTVTPTVVIQPSAVTAVTAQNTIGPQTSSSVGNLNSGNTVVTLDNVGYVTNGDGTKIPNAPIGSIVQTTDSGWFVVTTPKGDVVNTKDNPFHNA